MNPSIGRSVLLVVAAFVVAFVGCAIITGGLEGPDHVRDIVLGSVTIGLFGAAIAGGILSTPLTTRVRVLTGNDVALTRKLKSVVFRGDDVPLDEDEQRLAVRFAEASVPERTSHLAFITILYAALLLARFRDWGTDGLEVFDIVIAVALVAAYVIAVPIYTRQLFRARAYARTSA